MKTPTDDFAHKEPRSPKPRIKKIAIYALIFFTMTGLGFGTKIIISASEAIREISGGSILSQLKDLLLHQSQKIKGEKDNRINVLLLGIGGEGHEGPLLTDTIIVASIKPGQGEAALLSIPRDLYVERSDFGGKKINSLYALHEQKANRTGGIAIKKVVSEIFGIPIHYYALIDFSGFQELIDTVGGIDVYVDRSFTDSHFPAPHLKTQTVQFKEGLNHFDATTALIFARSRMGNAGEGSDFARSKRQQKIILAVKNELLNRGLLLRPNKIDKMIRILGDNIETDMKLWEIIEMAKLASKIQEQHIIQTVLDDSKEGPLRSIIGYDGAFLLIPKNSDDLKIRAQNIFTDIPLKNERATVIIQNGTEIPGLAAEMKKNLEGSGFTVLKTENALKKSYVKTVIFDLSEGEKHLSLNYLKQTFDANVSSYIPGDLWKEYNDADFVVIIGWNENTTI